MSATSRGAFVCLRLARCFFPDDADDLPKQPQRLAGLVYGPEKPAQWGENTRASDFYDLKGVLEFFLGALRTTVEVLRQPPPYLHPAKAGSILWEGESLGIFGEAHPRVALDWDFRRPPLILNWTLSAFIAVKNPRRRRRVALSRGVAGFGDTGAGRHCRRRFTGGDKADPGAGFSR